MTRHGEHAIVIGASMGGLVAAAALAPHYGRVTLLDRDRLPDEPRPRRGVPQGRHAHGLQPGGLLALEQLLPGLGAELEGGGAPAGDIALNGGWFVGGGRLARTRSGMRGLGITRPFLEHTVRARVAALRNVVVRDGVEVAALVSTPDGAGHRVVGVEVSVAHGPGETLPADLVVDCTGKVSKLPQWLHELGYEPPDEEQVRCRMAYLTRRWRLAADNPTMGADIVSVVAPADQARFGVIIAQEDGSYIVTLGGLFDDAPAKDDAAYRAFAASLPDLRIADALDGAEPVTEYQPSHFPASRRRRYDTMRRFPAGLLALGDSIASFNPMYGQGMSVAALEAVALTDLLGRGPLKARAFFKKAHRIEDVAWKISTGGDLRFPETEGRRTPDAKVMNAYLDRVGVAARTDPVVAHAFLAVAGFVRRPESLFAPSLVRRVLRGAKAARRAGVPQVQPVPAGRAGALVTT